jgi:hypothetical protein
MRSTSLLVLFLASAQAGASGCSSGSGDNGGGGGIGPGDGADDGADDGTPTGDDGGTGDDGEGDGTPTGDGGDTSDEGDDDGGAFVGEPDSGGIATCDPWTQDCPDGEKCVAWDSDGSGSVDSNRCVPVVDDPKEIGDECTPNVGGDYVDDCGVRAYCDFVNDEGVGICQPNCDGTPANPECPPGFMCSIDNDGVLLCCTETCDPLLQDCPAEVAICMEATGQQGFVCASGWGEDGIQEGEECYYINSCMEGLFCAAAEVVPPCVGTACCTPYCAVSEPVACTQPDYECIPYFDVPVPGYEDVGVCVVPA